MRLKNVLENIERYPAWQRLKGISYEQLKNERILLLMDKVRLELPPEACFDTNTDRASKTYYFLLAPEEIAEAFGVKTENVLRDFGDWCYVILEQTQSGIERKIDEIYRQYRQYSRFGLKCICLVNIAGDKKGTLRPDHRLERMKFMDYGEVETAEEISCHSFVMLQSKGIRTGWFNLTVDKWTKGIVFDDSATYFFQNPSLLLKQVEKETGIGSRLPGNEWLADFNQNASFFTNPVRAVMALLDYQELLLRLVAVSYYRARESEGKDPELSEEQLLAGHFNTIAKYIRSCAESRSEQSRSRIDARIPLTETLRMYLKNFTGIYMSVQFQGDSISFQGTVSLLQIIRNKLSAHGALNEKNAGCVWGILFWMNVLLHEYLAVEEFGVECGADQCLLGYERLIDAAPYVISRGGIPCVACRRKNDRTDQYVYLNFFTGEMVVPSYVGE